MSSVAPLAADSADLVIESVQAALAAITVRLTEYERRETTDAGRARLAHVRRQLQSITTREEMISA